MSLRLVLLRCFCWQLRFEPRNCLIMAFHRHHAGLLVFALLSSQARAGSPLLALGLEELETLQFQDTITLAQTPLSEAPAAITVITRKQIEASGARSLDELLDIFVPSFQYLYKVEGYQAGLRGVISDRNNKLLITVNGRSMNVLAADGGAIAERPLSMLGDIEKITVVSGPGSVIYGPGAIAGVIAIQTRDGHGDPGLQVDVRLGAGEDFASGELRYTRQFQNGLGLFAYYGIDKYPGASDDDSPLKIDHAFTAKDGTPVQAGEPLPFGLPNGNGSFQGDLRHKVHVQLNGENLELWARFTRGGQAIAAEQNHYSTIKAYRLENTGAANQQWTLFGRYRQQLRVDLSMEYTLSYQNTDVLIDIADDIPVGSTRGNRRWSEQQVFARVLAESALSPSQRLSLGFEYRYNDFGGRSQLKPSEPSKIFGLAPGTEWNSTLYSLLGEHQWRISSNWLAITGLRMDKHTYTPWMFSPRVALVHTSEDQRRTWKLIYNRSVRSADDAVLYRADALHHGELDVETIDHGEILFGHRLSPEWKYDVSIFFNRHNVIAFSPKVFDTVPLGKVDTAGLEFQLSHQNDRFDFRLSHSYVQLLDFSLDDPQLTIQNISAKPYGYGSDLANWFDHATKLFLAWHLTDRLDWNTSLRIYWSLPGGEDLSDYNKDILGGNPAAALADSDRPFGTSAFLNTGLQYRWSRHLSVSLTGYNLLGLVDEDLNKKNYFQRTSQYRVLAPSIALKLNYRF